MLLDEDCLRRILPNARELVVSDVEVIGQLAFLAAEIDFDEEPEEGPALDALNRSLWRIIGAEPQPVIPISPLPLPNDREQRARWIRELVPQLTSRDAREVAYVAAYLMAVADLQLAPVESELLDELQRALDIDDQRATDLRDAIVEDQRMAV